MPAANAATRFTAEYIGVVRRRLKIAFDKTGTPVFVHGRVKQNDLLRLRSDLDGLWAGEEAARQAIRDSEGATLQAVAFGLFDDFDLCLKTGYLMGDRVILWDYLHGRLLRGQRISRLDYDHLGVLANNIVSASNLAEAGHLVILPHPLDWSKDAKRVLVEVAGRARPTAQLQGLATSMAVARQLNVHPYTVLEEEGDWDALVGDRDRCDDLLDSADAGERYQALLGAAMSSRLLTDVRFQELLRMPVSRFAEVVSARADFYLAFRDCLAASSASEGSSRLKALGSRLERSGFLPMLHAWLTGF